jgi:hypothetical protein
MAKLEIKIMTAAIGKWPEKYLLALGRRARQ